MQDEYININAVDCRRWSEDINNRLSDIKAKDGEDVYRLMFVTAFLLLNFAEQLEGNGSAKLSRPADSELN